MITQGDLIRKGGLPLRLGLLSESDEGRLEAVLHPLASRQAVEVMTTPVVTIAENRPLAEAVDLMLERKVKRLPVVNDRGQLSGMLARLDIFRTVMRETPDWNAFGAQKIEVSDIKRVGDVLRRDTYTVFPETTIEDVIRLIDSRDVQRVAVVDSEGKLLGLISDLDLLRYFKSGEKGIWHRLAKKKRSFERDASQDNLQRQLAETTAGKVMTTDLITVHEEMRIEEAIGLMIEKGLKRLPVVEERGRFRGMISRDSLLRIGCQGMAS
jgi:CBS domain-containing protein